jgi:hypothetical protein
MVAMTRNQVISTGKSSQPAMRKLNLVWESLAGILVGGASLTRRACGGASGPGVGVVQGILARVWTTPRKTYLGTQGGSRGEWNCSTGTCRGCAMVLAEHW